MRSLLLLSLVACAPATPEQRYLGERSYRRERMAASLINPSNDYSRLRLAHYAADWDALPEWNPRVAAGAETPAALDLTDPQLGEHAFFRYPVQLWAKAPPGARSLVRVDAAGGVVIAATCATCHSTERNGAAVIGLANEAIDLGWGPGRVDVSTTDGSEPQRIPDLRPVRWLSHLHADATVTQPDVVALAMRLETLLITAHNQTVRPPREVTLALARYLWSLGPTSDPPANETFDAHCGGCHPAPAFSGAPVAIERVGTDPAVGRSRDRGTGFYRPPSLRGVRDRALLLHDGSVRSLEELLDPARTTPGHHFGSKLPAAERAEIIAYVRSL